MGKPHSQVFDWDHTHQGKRIEEMMREEIQRHKPDVEAAWAAHRDKCAVCRKTGQVIYDGVPGPWNLGDTCVKCQTGYVLVSTLIHFRYRLDNLERARHSR